MSEIPFSEEAEVGLLGSIIAYDTDGKYLSKVWPIVREEMFWNAGRGRVWTGLLTLANQGIPINVVSIRDVLRSMGAVGSLDNQIPEKELLRLCRELTPPTFVENFAQIIKARFNERTIIHKLDGLVKIAHDPAVSVETKISAFNNANSELIQSVASWSHKALTKHEDTTSIDDLIPIVPPEQPQLPLVFGWRVLDGAPALDAWNEPTPRRVRLNRGTLTGVLADTKVGKTILAENVAEANAKIGANVLFCHNELIPRAMRFRRYARHSGIGFDQLEDWYELTSAPTQEQRNQLVAVDNMVRGWSGRIEYLHCPGFTAAEIYRHAQELHQLLIATTGHGLDLVCVDYLSRLGVPKHLQGSGEASQTAYHLDQLSQLANKVEVAVLYTSQVGRETTTKKEVVRPGLHSGLNGGSIERYTNQLLSLYRNYLSPDRTERAIAEIEGLATTFSEPGWKEQLLSVPGRYLFTDL